MFAEIALGIGLFASAHAADPKPHPTAVSHPLGVYDAIASQPKIPGTHTSGTQTTGHSGGTSTPGCVIMPGSIPTMKVCGGNGAQYGYALPAEPGEAEAPTVTPAQLAAEAFQRLALPQPVVRTAPPRGRNGLVGLRHFFWADRTSWRVMTTRAEAGPVWAEVKAVPVRLIIEPGDGSRVVCQGPGDPYNLARSPEAQRSKCTHLFERSSAGRPAEAFKAKASAVWTASWRGSGQTSGALPSSTLSTDFPVRIAEGQALVQERG